MYNPMKHFGNTIFFTVSAFHFLKNVHDSLYTHSIELRSEITTCFTYKGVSIESLAPQHHISSSPLPGGS
jgi:hypothetical protein